LFSAQTAPGIVLFLSALLAVVAVNTPLARFHEAFVGLRVAFEAGGLAIDKPLLLWINDGLMAIFFLMVGLEIKREFLEGHLSSRDRAILPCVAALGGVAAPAAIYWAINRADEAAIRGWAIPTATDIAFALGAIMLLGSRVPAALKACLVAIAIIDDLAAVIVIAVFYTASISFGYLAMAGLGLAVAALMNWRRVGNLGAYALVGVFVWVCVLKSGVHATLAGVAIGLLVPLRGSGSHSPLKSLEHALHPWVSFGVLPIFAFANSGLSLKGMGPSALLEPVTLGILLGLFLGKQAGVMGAVAAGCALGICRLPQGVGWAQFYGMALLTGIGFTMSLFIGSLAFDDEAYATPVRVGVLGGSLVSAAAGIALLLRTRPLATAPEAASPRQAGSPA